MRNLTKWLTWLLLASLVAACIVPSATTASPLEPGAGKWPTWVLTAPDQVRPPAPPDQAATQKELQDLKALVAQRDATALAQVAYWDAGAPPYRWIQIALAQLKSKPFSNPRNLRALSLLNVAMYDATIAAWNAKYSYNRPRPNQADPSLKTLVATPNSPTYPSEHAVAAGAAAAILGYLYPDDAATFQAKAEEAGHSRVMAGVQYPSDVQAGLELGRAVAAKVIERAKADGSDAKWTGSVPTEPGHWTGTNPIDPLAGTWKPWVLTAGNEFRPPAPPAYDSAQEATELQEIKSYTRTWQSNEKALYWQTFEGIFTDWYNLANARIFEQHLDTDPPAAARIYAAMGVAQYESIIACWDAKYTYWAIRPAQLDKTVTTLFPTPNHPSYPSSHSCDASSIAAVLEAFFPADAKFFQARADEAGMSRLWAGIHFHTDIDAGLTLGRAVAQKVLERAMVNGQ